LVKARTAQANQIRGLLHEFGITLPQGIGYIAQRLPAILEDGANGLPGILRKLLDRLFAHLGELERQVAELEREIQSVHRADDASRRLAEIPGIGPLTASALLASIGQGSAFRNGRQLAAWIGLVPRQHSTGGKATLLGISKRGDAYLRTLFIHGARTLIRHWEHKTGRENSWLTHLLRRRNKNVATVALANRNARIAWALLAHGRRFDPGYASARLAA